jgi:hypothetical protein
MPATPPTGSPCTPGDLEAWFADLGLESVARADRDGVTAWDLVLGGSRRPELRVTVILDPSLAVICWAHYAPPISDRFRVSYRRLLRWNDELPFVKFSLAQDERPVLSAELPVASVDGESLGLALARLLAVADHLLPESVDWLVAGGWPVAGNRPGTAGPRLLARFASALGELASPAGEPMPPTARDSPPTGVSEPPPVVPARRGAR